jgi:hypothetical protein
MNAAATPSAALDGHRKYTYDSVCLSRQGPHSGTARPRDPQRFRPVAELAVSGRSTRPLPNWLLTKVDEITDLILLDQIFPGGRPTASGKHIEWDVLFIRVKPASDHQHAGSG